MSDSEIWLIVQPALCFPKVQAAFYFSGSLPNVLLGYLKPKSPTVLFPFQHLPTLQFLQQQRFDFFRPRL